MSTHNQMRNESEHINESIIKNHDKEFTYMEMEVIKEYSDKIEATRIHTMEKGFDHVRITTESISVFLKVSTVTGKREIYVSKLQFTKHSSIRATKVDQIKTFLNEG